MKLNAVWLSGLLAIVLAMLVPAASMADSGSDAPAEEVNHARDEPGVRTAARADSYATEHWPNTYSSYWGSSTGDRKVRRYHFAFTKGAARKLERIKELFPLREGSYRAATNSFSFQYLLKLQRRITWDLQRLWDGKLKAPGRMPTDVGTDISPKKDCLVVVHGQMNRPWRKWMKKRYGAAATCLVKGQAQLD